MENRSYALLAGLFTLALVVATALIAIWLGHDKKTVVLYEIISSDSVSGLSAQSAVRFQGVPVGRVQTLYLDPDKPGKVHIRIAVGQDTPITDATWAELGVQGITGLAVVELREQGQTGRRLETSKEFPAQIPLRPGLFSRLESQSSTLLDNLNQTAIQLRSLLTPDNTQALSAALKDTAEITAQLKKTSRELAPLAGQMNTTMKQVGDAALQASGMVQEARTALARINAPDGTLAAAAQSIQQITQVAARLNGRTLPAMDDMATRVSGTARSTATILRRVGDAPQSFVFGLPPVEPGPGEAGFAGFGGN